MSGRRAYCAQLASEPSGWAASAARCTGSRMPNGASAGRAAIDDNFAVAVVVVAVVVGVGVVPCPVRSDSGGEKQG